MTNTGTVKQYRYAVFDKNMIFQNTFYFYSCLNEEIRSLSFLAAKGYFERVYHWRFNDWKPNATIYIEIFKEEETSLGIFKVTHEVNPSFLITQETESIHDNDV